MRRRRRKLMAHHGHSVDAGATKGQKHESEKVGEVQKKSGPHLFLDRRLGIERRPAERGIDEPLPTSESADNQDHSAEGEKAINIREQLMDAISELRAPHLRIITRKLAQESGKLGRRPHNSHAET
jgi:hypothetical protein